MGICPVDQKPCCDDLCYGGECLRGGGEMWFKCASCGKYHADEDLYGICTGDPDEFPCDEDEHQPQSCEPQPATDK